MNCSKCGIDFTKAPLYRNAPIGVSCKDWRCENCLDEEFKPSNSAKEIADIIIQDNQK